jgi:hypothetical protein
MTFDPSSSTIVDLNFNQLYLEIPPTASSRSRSFSTPGARRRAELNQRCLDAFLPWLREEQTATPYVWTREEALPSFWEIVNGTAISIDTIRLVLIPTEAIELSEFRVSQEWVDIPTWAADYYLSVQVNLEEEWIRVAGYVTHQKLKAIGTYDASDRTYCFNTIDLIEDINVLWLARHFCPDERLRSDLQSLPTLPQSQAENLLERLGNSNLVFPRLEIPFHLWGSLIEHGGWRQRLYEQRQGLPEQWSIQHWLQTGISNMAQQLGWGQIEVSPAAITTGTRSAESQLPTLCLSRQFNIAGDPYELRVFPQGHPTEQIWRFELRRVASPVIPAGVTLRLLTEDLQPFENNTDTATSDVESLYVEVMLELGEGLVWETEPPSEDYDREILRF